MSALPLNQIRPSRYQVRKTFDPQALQELAQSMKSQGLIEPIVVRKAAGATPYELISGERRLRAAKLLGWTEIEAVISEVKDESEAAANGLVENVQHETLNAIEEAEGFAMLQKMDKLRWTQETLAATIGKSQAYVSQSFALLSLKPSIRQNITQVIFTRAHGVQLARLPPELQEEIASKIKDKLTVPETRELVNQALGGHFKAVPKSPSKALSAPAWQQGEDVLLGWNGLRVTVQASFDPRKEDLNDLLDRIEYAWPSFEVSHAQTPDQTAQLGKLIARRNASLAKKLSKPASPKPAKPAEPATPSLPTLAELESLAAQGPEALYSRAYGADSPEAAQVKGLTWKDLQVSNPKNAAQAVFAVLSSRTPKV